MKKHKKTPTLQRRRISEKMRKELQHMKYSIKKPIAQGVVEYGHFRAVVKVYDNNERYAVEMIKPFRAATYQRDMDYFDWDRKVESELRRIKYKVEDFAAAARKVWRNKNAV